MSKKKTQEDTSAPMFEIPGESGVEMTAPKAIPAQDPLLSDVDANDIVGNSECIFTEGCRGRIHIYNTVRVAVQDGEKQIVETRQQLRCKTCGKIAKGYRVAGLPGARRLFDRRAKN